MFWQYVGVFILYSVKHHENYFSLIFQYKDIELRMIRRLRDKVGHTVVCWNLCSGLGSHGKCPWLIIFIYTTAR